MIKKTNDFVKQNLVTAAQKLNRKGILNKYRKEVDQAYGSAS